MPKDDVATIIIQNGLTHKVNVICKFSAQIDNQMFSFIIHRTLSVCRYALVCKATGQRIAVLDTSRVKALGMEAAGKLALSDLASSLGETRLAAILTNSLQSWSAASE